MHSTGEKTNPGPLGRLLTQLIHHRMTERVPVEAMLKNDPFVSGSMIFGRGRFHTGILVQPKAEFELNPMDMNKVADFRNLIW